MGAAAQGRSLTLLDCVDGSRMAQLCRRPLYSGGPQVSVLGFGASPLGGVFSAIDEDTGVASVHEASRLGVNFFDCSPCVSMPDHALLALTHPLACSFYGNLRAETVLGRALQGLPRESVRWT